MITRQAFEPVTTAQAERFLDFDASN